MEPLGEQFAAAAGTSDSRRRTIFAAGLIALAAVAAYHNSFGGPFIHDDVDSIVKNPTIRQWTALRQVLSPPPNGQTVGGRPLLNVTLALNYALGGLNVRGYHVVNLLIHLAAALVLFGILRRTFRSAGLRERFGRASTALALAVTLVWTVHPLQTESVTYIVQRAESLAGLFYLLTLYCVIRGSDGGRWAVGSGQWEKEPPTTDGHSPTADRRLPTAHRFWYVMAVLACLLGMATKEVIVTAPLLVFLYDRTFLAGSFAEAWRRRWGLYLALAATEGLLLYLMASLVVPGAVVGRLCEAGSHNPWTYARSEPGVIAYYLRLSLWPAQLQQQYSWAVASRPGEVFPAVLAIGVLLATTVWGLMSRQAWSFLGAWFFLILAPTSSFLPLGQMAYEHRMYLSLAAVAALVVVAGYVCCDHGRRPQADSTRPAVLARRIGPVAVLAGVLLVLGWATTARNREYRSTFMPYQDAINRCPHSPLAHFNFAIAMGEAGRIQDAVAHYRESLRLEPNPEAYNNLGMTLAGLGSSAEAIGCYREALRMKPDFIAAHNNLSNVLASVGKVDVAIKECEQALRLDPHDAVAHNSLAALLAAAGRLDEAIAHYTQALRLKPDYVPVHNNLGVAFAGAGRVSEAIEQYHEALRWDPAFAEAHSNLGNALAGLGRTDEAIQHYRETLRLKPDYPEAHRNLGAALAAEGKTAAAIAHYREALRLKPDFPVALREASWLLATHGPEDGGDPPLALRWAERTCELSGAENPRCLDTLAAAYAAAGRCGEAVTTAEKAIQLAESTGQTALAKEIQSRCELYRAGRPCRAAAPEHSSTTGATR